MLEKIKINQTEIANAIKTLIYKESAGLLKKVDFDNENIFLEPLLFAYFNSKEDNHFPNQILEGILQGYFLNQIKQSYNKVSIDYVPNIGYFKEGETIPFEPIQIIKNTNIEIFKYSVTPIMYIF
jgi:hypothetical protein